MFGSLPTSDTSSGSCQPVEHDVHGPVLIRHSYEVAPTLLNATLLVPVVGDDGGANEVIVVFGMLPPRVTEID